MKIKELIKILKLSPDQERDVYIESLESHFATNIITSFDDNGDIRIYERGDADSKK